EVIRNVGADLPAPDNPYFLNVLLRKVKPEIAEKIKNLVEFTLDYSQLEGADFIIEAATEREDIKHKIFDDLQDRCPDAILASNSSHMEPEVIFKDIKDKTRCVGIHYFFPADRNQLVEIIPGEFTDPELVHFLKGFYEQIGKAPIKVNSRYGYAVDPIFEGLFQAAALIVEEGIASTKQVDTVASKALGLGVGPFTAMNLTGGNPITQHGLNEMNSKVMPWFKTPKILDDQIEAGKPWEIPERGEKVEIDDETFEKVAGLMKGAYFGLVGEILESGITNISDLEMALEIGLVIKPPFGMMNKMGVSEAVNLVKAYAGKYEGFTVAKCLTDQAASGEPWKIPVVIREDRGDFAVVTIRRPRVLNALNPVVIEQLRETFEGIAGDGKIRGAVLTGFGNRAFVSGADINKLAQLKSPDEGRDFALVGQEVLNMIEDLDKPVICAMNGLAFGGGNELAMACHARLAPRGLRVLAGQPEPKLGIIPGYGGTQRLVRWTGIENAWPLLRNGNPISSEVAHQIGLIHEEVQGNLLEAALDLLDKAVSGKIELRKIPRDPLHVPESLPDVDIGPLSKKIDAIMQDAVVGGAKMTLRDGLKHEATMFGECLKTKDTQIGMENFIKNGPKVAAEFVHE
ncbi:3-hydroxyacyl-CoA dehydrogenase/enoyl-CoA hydratase family protein, partial [Acidobacteriota bacterium]